MTLCNLKEVKKELMDKDMYGIIKRREEIKKEQKKIKNKKN